MAQKPSTKNSPISALPAANSSASAQIVRSRGVAVRPAISRNVRMTMPASASRYGAAAIGQKNISLIGRASSTIAATPSATASRQGAPDERGRHNASTPPPISAAHSSSRNGAVSGAPASVTAPSYSHSTASETGRGLHWYSRRHANPQPTSRSIAKSKYSSPSHRPPGISAACSSTIAANTAHAMPATRRGTACHSHFPRAAAVAVRAAVIPPRPTAPTPSPAAPAPRPSGPTVPDRSHR